MVSFFLSKCLSVYLITHKSTNCTSRRLGRCASTRRRPRAWSGGRRFDCPTNCSVGPRTPAAGTTTPLPSAGSDPRWALDPPCCSNAQRPQTNQGLLEEGGDREDLVHLALLVLIDLALLGLISILQFG